MNIEKSDQMPLTEGNRALQLFTDRDEFTRQFAGYLNDGLPPEKILFFHGEGGNGKSLLLKFLREKCCKRFSPQVWSELKFLPDKAVADFVEKIETDFTPVPCSFLDFGQNAVEDDRPRDRFHGLLMLRRRLSAAALRTGHRLRFPLYDFACFWYLRSKGKSVREIKQLFPAAENLEFISVLLDAVSESSYANIARVLFNAVAKSWGERLSIGMRKQGLDEAWIESLMATDPDSELVEKLAENCLRMIMSQRCHWPGFGNSLPGMFLRERRC